MDFANALLSETVSSGNATHVRSLLAAGADPNQTSQSGQTPLILAIVSGNLHLVQILLDAGADPSQRDQTGLNAIEWAERKGFPDVAKGLQNPKQARGKIAAEPLPARTITEPVRDTSLTSDEKSRRWIAGLKQRLDEKADRERLATQNDSIPVPVVKASEPIIESPVAPKDVAASEPIIESPVTREDDPKIDVEERDAVSEDSDDSGSATSGSARKRCPQCNTVYNSPLVAYCAYHVVPLIDIDAPVITPAPSIGMTPVLWVLVAITFLGAGLIAYLIITPFYRKQETQAVSLPPQPPSIPGKGIPVVSGDLSGKALVIPDVFAPSKLTEPVTVVVRIKVDKKGQVYSAQATGGDEQLRDAVLKSARKAEFSTDDIGLRGAQTTITYMFKP